MRTALRAVAGRKRAPLSSAKSWRKYQVRKYIFTSLARLSSVYPFPRIFFFFYVGLTVIGDAACSAQEGLEDWEQTGRSIDLSSRLNAQTAPTVHIVGRL